MYAFEYIDWFLDLATVRSCILSGMGREPPRRIFRDTWKTKGESGP